MEIPQCEWSGAMSRRAKQRGDTPGLSTQFVFGPLIDSSPTDPDTVLSTIRYVEEIMKQYKKQYIFLSRYADL